MDNLEWIAVPAIVCYPCCSLFLEGRRWRALAFWTYLVPLIAAAKNAVVLGEDGPAHVAMESAAWIWPAMALLLLGKWVLTRPNAMNLNEGSLLPPCRRRAST